MLMPDPLLAGRSLLVLVSAFATREKWVAMDIRHPTGATVPRSARALLSIYLYCISRAQMTRLLQLRNSDGEAIVAQVRRAEN
jgi:hypothetical protein